MALQRREDVVQQIRDALRSSDPDLDTTVGTLPRKMMDAFGDVIAEGYADRHLLDYQYDIEAKSGSDLDDFVKLLGQTRLPARRASGSVTFESLIPVTDIIFIAAGTQIATNDNPPVRVATIVPAIFEVGDTSVTVPVQALSGGSVGNVAAGTLNVWGVSALGGINSISNTLALSGGTDAETDAQLRTRVKRTAFRSMAGTESMFEGVALEDPDVSLVNVVGAAKRHREQIQIVGGAATSTVTNAAYVYPDTVFFGSNIDAGEVFTPGVHYSFATTLPPTVAVIDAVTIPDGVYELTYLYLPTASRNDPASGITNRVDVYVNGIRNTEAIETLIFNTAVVFNTTVGNVLKTTNFEREDGSHPVAGNYFTRLAFSPATDPSITDHITIGAQTYDEGIDYWLVNDVTNVGGASTSRSGIEWWSVANGQTQTLPANGTLFTADYLYNAIPRDIEIGLRQWRLVTTDVKVHQAKPLRLNIYLIVILSAGYVASQVQAEIYSALQTFINAVGFDGVVQVSDIIAIAHDVPGVDAVRLATNTDDGTHYAIQRVSNTGTLISTYHNGGTPHRAIDVLSSDDQYPLLNAVTITVAAQNTFGAV